MLKAGIGIVDITPKYPLELYGYMPYLNRVSTGVHDNLFAQALILTDDRIIIVLISCDLCEMDRTLILNIKRSIARRTGLKKVIVCATHTHSAPAVCHARSFGEIDCNYYSSLPKLISDAVQEGIHNLAPVSSFGGDRISTDNLNRNRYDENGYVDKDIDVLSIKLAHGKTIALTTFACHAVTRYRKKIALPDGTYAQEVDTKISGDYPSAAARCLNRGEGLSQMVFLQGSAGNLNPSLEFDQTGKTEEMGKLFADYVVRALSATTPVPHAPLAFINEKIFLNFVIPSREDIIDVATEKRKQLHPGWKRFWNEWELCMLRKLDSNSYRHFCEVELNVLKIGECVFLFHPAELFAELGAYVKDSLPGRTYVIGHANDYIGYLPTQTDFKKRDYTTEIEPAALDIFPFEDYAGEKVAETIIRLARKI